MISILVWTKDTNPVFFREMLASLLEQSEKDFELVVLDENRGRAASEVVFELFANDGRLHYHALKNRRGLAYAFNAGLHRMNGDYAYLLGQHDTISFDAVERITEAVERLPETDILYSDHDELVGIDRMNPCFKPDLNVELLRHKNYIGDCIVVSRRAMRRLGRFNENLMAASVYDILLRAVANRLTFTHIPRLLYHQRVYAADFSKNEEFKRIREMIYREHMAVCTAHLKRMEVRATVERDRSGDFWRVMYDGSDYRRHRSKYLLVREESVRIRRKNVTERMYGILRQPDVGLVGARFDGRGFTIENCGYIFDKEGMIYPACHGQSALQRGYEDRAVLPHDVSLVDPAFFMIDPEVFRKVGGLNRRLKGRAQMLDLCFRIRRARRRVVVDPGVVAKKKVHENVSSEESNVLLQKKWAAALENGDPYYNPNLPMGQENYMLFS